MQDRPRIFARAAAAAAGLLRVRWFVRAPIWLFRARLGMLFGSRLLLLEHIGRKTGARRYVVLEVVARPAHDTYVVASGFGERSQWYRNVQNQPHVRVTVGSHAPRHAVARTLDAAEARQALSRYVTEHPRAWRALRPVFEQTLGATINEQGTSLPLVALTIDRRNGKSS